MVDRPGSWERRRPRRPNRLRRSDRPAGECTHRQHRDPASQGDPVGTRHTMPAQVCMVDWPWERRRPRRPNRLRWSQRPDGECTRCHHHDPASQHDPVGTRQTKPSHGLHGRLAPGAPAPSPAQSFTPVAQTCRRVHAPPTPRPCLSARSRWHKTDHAGAGLHGWLALGAPAPSPAQSFTPVAQT